MADFGNRRTEVSTMMMRQGQLPHLLLLLVLFEVPHAWAAPLVQYDIPAGDATDTLQLYLQATKVEMLYLTEALRGIKTNALHGNYAPRVALEKLLEGTGLEYHFTDDERFVSVKLAATSAAGFGSRELNTSGPSSPLSFPLSSPSIAEVAITGTRLRGVIDAAAPLVQRQRQEIARSDYASVQDVVRSLPMATYGGPSEVWDPGRNFGRGTGLDLRGLGTAATLVLVNGRRQAPSGFDANFVDVSHIPWSAVKRIDILPDGASAIYGADAIAGVVNILLRDDVSGAETQGRWGLGTDGADERLAAQLWGVDWESGRATLAYQFTDRGSLAAASRWYTANADKRPYGGSDHRSILSNPGNILDPQTGLPAFAIPENQDGKHLTVMDLLPGTPNLENRYSDLDLLPDAQMHSGYARLHQQLSSHLSLTGEGIFTQRDIDQRNVPLETVLVVPASNPFSAGVNPYALPVIVVGYSFADDFGPVKSVGHTRYGSGALALDLELPHDWHSELSAAYSGEWMNIGVRDQVDLDALQSALADPREATAFNPFGAGSATNPETLARIRREYQQRAMSSIRTISLTADGVAGALPAGTIHLALGLESRRESLSRGLSPRSSFDRTINSVFAELALPLAGSQSEPLSTPRLSVAGAGRCEIYSDVGAACSPKVGVQAIVSSALKIRGSWSRSFRAPQMSDLYDTQRDSAGLLRVPDAHSPTGSSLALVEEGSNPSLRNETASTYSLGMDIAPLRLPNFTGSVTYFRTRYSQRISRLSASIPLVEVLANPNWSELVTRAPARALVDSICASAAFLGDPKQCELSAPDVLIDARVHNLNETLTDGLDVTASYVRDTRVGHLGLVLEGTYLLGFTEQATHSARKTSVLNRVGYPLTKRLRMTTSWARHGTDRPGPHAALTVDYRGAYRDFENSSRIQALPSWTRLDLSLGWNSMPRGTWLSGLKIELNVANVWNADPPLVDREFGFDPVNSVPYGRVLSVTAIKQW